MHLLGMLEVPLNLPFVSVLWHGSRSTWGIGGKLKWLSPLGRETEEKWQISYCANMMFVSWRGNTKGNKSWFYYMHSVIHRRTIITNTWMKHKISLSRFPPACVLWNHLFANRMSPVRAHQCLCLSWKWHISHFWHTLSVLYPSNLCSAPPPSPGLTKIQFTGCQLNSIILSTAVVERWRFEFTIYCTLWV